MVDLNRVNQQTLIQYFDNGSFLVNLADIHKLYHHPLLLKHTNEINILYRYLKNYVAKPNPEVGRSDPVCPFTPGALRTKSMFFSITNNTLDTEEKQRKIEHIFLEYLKIFLEMHPTSGRTKYLKAIVMVFSKVFEGNYELIEVVQQRLKATFTNHGLMIGQFYPTCPSPGIHNPEYRPLQSPLPLLVIRHMMPVDYFFLTEYQEAYFKTYPKNHPPEARAYFEQYNRGII